MFSLETGEAYLKIWVESWVISDFGGYIRRSMSQHLRPKLANSIQNFIEISTNSFSRPCEMKLNVPIFFLMAYCLKKHSNLLLDSAVPCIPKCIHWAELAAKFEECMFSHSKKTNTIWILTTVQPLKVFHSLSVPLQNRVPYRATSITQINDYSPYATIQATIKANFLLNSNVLSI